MKKIIVVIIIGFQLFSSYNKSSFSIQQKHNHKKQSYQSDEYALVQPAFMPLPPGAIRPKGWLNDWALLAANGITGHLDEWSPTFGEAWKGKGFIAEGTNVEDGTGWALEQCAYWLDGAVRLAYILNDSVLIRKVSTRLDTVVEGVLNNQDNSLIYWKPKDFVAEGKTNNANFNSWSHSHMARALLAYYEATGKEKVLKALLKAYSNYPLPIMPEKIYPVTGAVNVDPMIKLYTLTGDTSILENILEMTKSKSFNQTIDKWIDGKFESRHGVVFYENIRIPAMLYPLTGNKKYLESFLSANRWLDQHILPCGVASSEEFNAGIGSTRNIETCNVSTSAWTYQKVFEITGDSDWGDAIEKVFFNAVPAAVDSDFKMMCYYQSPNRINGLLPSAAPIAPGHDASPYIFRPTGHPVLCCVGNVNRAIPNYIMHMWMTTLDNGIAATLYGPSEVKTTVSNGVGITIKTETNYPFTEDIVLSLYPERETDFPLYLRIPEWCKNPSIRINGKDVVWNSNDKGFALIKRAWQNEDKVSIHFPMQVNIISGNETSYPQVKYFKNNRKQAIVRRVNNPFQSVYYGPLLLALPVPDKGENSISKEYKGTFNFALNMNSEKTNELTTVLKQEMNKPWHWQLDDSPLKIRVRAKQFDWEPTELQPLPQNFVSAGKDTTIVLVPYNMTKFRISMFPVCE